jgi:hypothetical protein
LDEMDLPTTTSVVLENGALIDVRAAGTGGSADVAARALSFAAVTASLSGVTESVLAAVRHARPDEVTVEFGLNVSAESGRLASLLVSADAQADLKVVLKWTADSDKGRHADVDQN